MLETRACAIFSQRFIFDSFSTVNTNTICVTSLLSFLKALSKRCVFDEKAQHIIVVGRPVGMSTFLFAVFSRKTTV